MSFTHGGDWAGFYEKTGTLPMDFSANISPLGLPKGVREAVKQALDRADRYPDPFCRKLREEIGRTFSVPPSWILCGNGAGDLIERLVQAVRPRQALVTAPTFSEYPAALLRIGCAVHEYPLGPENGFRLTDPFLQEITAETDIVFLCEPNNPTGVTTEPDLLLEIMERCERCGALLVVDECFNALLSEPKKHTLLPYLATHRLLILNAFTKSHGMAGLRLGFCLCRDMDLLEMVRQSGQPWPVSVVAQEAGIAALQDSKYPLRLRALLDRQRPVLRSGLAGLGAARIAGEANYLLFHHADLNLADKLVQKGVLIRRCDDYAGLGPGWYRVAIRGEEENQWLLQTIRQVIQ